MDPLYFVFVCVFSHLLFTLILASFARYLEQFLTPPFQQLTRSAIRNVCSLHDVLLFHSSLLLSGYAAWTNLAHFEIVECTRSLMCITFRSSFSLLSIRLLVWSPLGGSGPPRGSYASQSEIDNTTGRRGPVSVSASINSYTAKSNKVAHTLPVIPGTTSASRFGITSFPSGFHTWNHRVLLKSQCNLKTAYSRRSHM